MKSPVLFLFFAVFSVSPVFSQEPSLEEQVKALRQELESLKKEVVTTKTAVNTLAQENEALKEQVAPVGSIQAYAGDKIPEGWKLCDGAELDQSAYPKLFNAIGKAWGGSGTKFRLPDLRGRFLRGVSGTSSTDPDKDSRTSLYSGGNKGNQTGSYQEDAFEQHSHPITKDKKVLEWSKQEPKGGWSSPSGTYEGLNTGNPETLYKIGDSGSSETRPANAYVYFIIKYE